MKKIIGLLILILFFIPTFLLSQKIKPILYIKAGHSSIVNSIAFSPNGKYLASGSNDGTIMLWDLSVGRKVKSFIGHSKPISCVTFSSNSMNVASSSWDKSIKIWDLNSDKLIHTFTGHPDYISCIRFSPDNKTIASGGGENDPSIKFWDLSTGKEMNSFIAHHHGVKSIEFIKNGKILVSGGSDRSIKLWDVNNGNLIKSFSEYFIVNSIALSPDGNLIASGSDTSINIWNISTGKQVMSFTNHSTVLSIAFSPDGKTLVNGSTGSPIKLWDISTGKKIKSLMGLAKTITFTNDGKLLASIEDEKIKLWSVSSGAKIVSLISLDLDDWVVVTKDGRFDGSNNGTKLLIWNQNDRPLPLDAFFEKYFYPGLLTKIISGKLDPITEPDLDLVNEIRLPPLIQIVSPKMNEMFETEKVQIKTIISDLGGGIDEIRLYNNGKLIIDDKEITFSGRKVSKTYEVTLLPGKNLISATAFNKDRTEFTPYPEVSVYFSAVKSNIDMYILAIGINEYKNPKYNLKFCKKDAQDFINILEDRGKGIFGKIVKYEIYNNNAIKENIESAIKNIIRDTRPKDVFVFYYAGHGAMSEKLKNISEDFYLIPNDITQVYGNDEGLASKGISANMLKDYFKNIQAQKQLVILDACYSGGAVKTIAQRNASDEKSILQLARSSGSAIFAASLEEQTAKECGNLNHGVFTYTLIQGLGGSAAMNGQITISSLKSYLDQQVPEVSMKCSGKEQFPIGQFYGQDFPIGVVK